MHRYFKLNFWWIFMYIQVKIHFYPTFFNYLKWENNLLYWLWLLNSIQIKYQNLQSSNQILLWMIFKKFFLSWWIEIESLQSVSFLCWDLAKGGLTYCLMYWQNSIQFGSTLSRNSSPSTPSEWTCLQTACQYMEFSLVNLSWEISTLQNMVKCIISLTVK